MSADRISSSRHAALFSRADWLAGLIAGLLSFAVYAWTAAPSVTLLDSGEFILAAQAFGVPHPTGYPLWTLLGWLFQLLPLGNAAWEITLLSAIFGALAVGLAALLIRSAGAWYCPHLAASTPVLTSALAISSALVFAFSLSMWTQATIVEVYTLHALLIGLYLTTLYAWVRDPASERLIYWVFFTFSLAFSNHQLTLALAPLPFLLVLALRRDLLWDLGVAAAVSVLIAYLTFALFTDSPVVIKAAVRLTYLVVTLVGIILLVRRFRLRWRLIALLPVAILLGLLPYAYLPVASATNPPMNWGYTRTADGFFASFNRSQYRGTLSDQSLRVLGKVVGVSELAPTSSASTDNSQPSTFAELRTWTPFFAGKLLASYSPLAVLFLAVALAAAFWRTARQRTWTLLLASGFALAAFLQPALDRAQIDVAGWWLQLPYHAHTNLLFTLLCATGLFQLTQLLLRLSSLARKLGQAVAWSVVFLPLWPLVENASTASQRHNWLGYEYGHEMLRDLPPGSVVLGGTDPGRFIPTYLALGESPQRANVKRDPTFDRRDLFILTQNGFADRHYLAYVRDQYTTDRPTTTNAFERWLGRDTAYPDDTLVLPTLDEVRRILRDTSAELQARQPAPSSTEIAQDAQAAVVQWIFDENRSAHAFYVEESYPLRWSYPYAIPEGLLYRINPSPVDTLPPEAVAADQSFWKEKTASLLANPTFRRDFDAQRAFSKLRTTGGNLYAFRQLLPEASIAYRQALSLNPISIEALRGLTEVLWAQRDYDEPIALLDAAIALDPHNPHLRSSRATAVRRRDVERQITTAESAHRANPTSLATLEELITLHSRVGNTSRVTELLKNANQSLGADPAFLLLAVRIAEARSDWPASVRYGLRRTTLEPTNPDAFYRLGRAQYADGQTAEATLALGRSITLGGPTYRQRLFDDPIFAGAARDPAIAELFND